MHHLAPILKAVVVLGQAAMDLEHTLLAVHGGF